LAASDPACAAPGDLRVARSVAALLNRLDDSLALLGAINLCAEKPITAQGYVSDEKQGEQHV